MDKYRSFLIKRIKIFFLLLMIIILFFAKFSNKINNNLIKNIRICICTLAKNENKYIKEFIEHYKTYGVDKIFLYDNNDINGEKFEEVINDFVKNGFVKILNWRGEKQTLFKIMNNCYQTNYNYYDFCYFMKQMNIFIYIIIQILSNF